MEVIIYVNGKRVTKDEIKTMEIQNEEVKDIIRGHLTSDKS